MATQHTTVTDLLRDVAPDEEIRIATEKRIIGRNIIKHLMAMRAVQGLSQNDVAQKLNCVQSRISKLENALDDDVRVGDLRAYAKAVGCEFMYGIRPLNPKPFDTVKCHVFAIKKHTDYLAEMAKKDETIARAVSNFFVELFFNFARLFSESVKRLPLAPNDEPYLDFRFGEMCFSEECDQEDLANDDNSSGNLLPAAP